jgi:MarR family transcriptional regulator for hemolysin
MARPLTTPIGLALAKASRQLNRAFDAELAAAGGSLPIWLILLSVRSSSRSSQRQLAEAVGIDSATLTHHLNRMEQRGLVTRRRNPANRREHEVSINTSGEELFRELAATAQRFDSRIRSGLEEQDVAQFRSFLISLVANITDEG